MKNKTGLYPGTAAAEKEKEKAALRYSYEFQPDFIGGKPNYDKFASWTCEKVLAWLNID